MHEIATDAKHGHSARRTASRVDVVHRHLVAERDRAGSSLRARDARLAPRDDLRERIATRQCARVDSEPRRVARSFRSHQRIARRSYLLDVIHDPHRSFTLRATAPLVLGDAPRRGVSTETTQPAREPEPAPPTIHRGASETRLDALPVCSCDPNAPRCTCARSRALADLHHRTG